MQERRMYARKLADAKVRIYHSDFGTQEGRISDISEKACRLTLIGITEQIGDLDPEAEEFITLRPLNMDVVFKMSFVRKHDNGVVLKFEDCEEGMINADAL